METLDLDAMYLGLAAATVGPSLGQWYAGRWFTAGLGIRLASTALVVTALELDRRCHAGCGKEGTYATLAYVGIGGLVVGAVHDIVTAPGAAREYNQKHALTLSLGPTLLRSPGGPAYGLAAHGSF
jgi:hypothetical protein